MSPPWSAALYLVAATFSFSTMSLVVKVAAPRYPAAELVLIRGVIGLPILWVLARFQRASLLGRRRGLLLGRAAAGTIALFLFFTSLEHLPVAQAMLLNQSTPIFALPLAALFLGERITLRHALLVSLAIAGVVLIVRPQAATLNVPALLGLLSALFAAAAYVQVRELAMTERPVTIVFWFTAVSAVAGLVAALPSFVPPRPGDLPALLGVGAFAMLGQVLLTMAYARGEVGRLAVLGSLGAVFGAIWDLAIWGHVPDGWTALGGGIAIAACATLQVSGRRPGTGPG